MNFHILTLFPDVVMGGLGTSIPGRAMESKTISVEAIDIRDYSKDKHRHREKADWLDPFIAKKDNYLNSYDMDRILQAAVPERSFGEMEDL